MLHGTVPATNMHHAAHHAIHVQRPGSRQENRIPLGKSNRRISNWLLNWCWSTKKAKRKAEVTQLQEAAITLGDVGTRI